MSKSGISGKKAVFLLSAIALIVLTYFLIYQKNMEKVRITETNITKLEMRISELANMEIQVRELEKTSDAKKAETEKYISLFTPVTTSEKTIYQIYQMMTATGTRVSSVDFGNYYVFLQDGTIFREGEAPKEETTDTSGTDTPDGQNSAEAAEEAPGDTIESNMDMIARLKELEQFTKKPLNQVNGKVLVCSLGISGTYRQCMKALDWISGNKEKMSVGAVSLSYDNSTGKLSGKIDVEFYEMRGTGNPYLPPNVQGFQYGIDNVFRTK